MSEEVSKAKITVELMNDYAFKVTFPDAGHTMIVMDEPPPLGSLRGPNAARLLSASVANCLSASLLFCLKRSKVEVKGMRAEAEPIIERNKEGYWRVSKIIVSLRAELAETVQAEKARRCIEVFENYCVVTGSVRGGITVDVRVEAPSGTDR